jgi:hypothetical protein
MRPVREGAAALVGGDQEAAAAAAAGHVGHAHPGLWRTLDREPKVVVIMAGDDMPSFIASARPFAFFLAVSTDAGELPSKADAA